MRAAGIQPIVGCTLAVNLNEGHDESGSVAANIGENSGPNTASLALIAKDRVGYANLMELSSRAFLDNGDTQTPHISRTLLKSHSDGLIVLTGGPEGPIDKAIHINAS